MFNKNTSSTYLIPHPSSSFDVNGLEILLHHHHHHHHDLFSGGGHYAPNIIGAAFNNNNLDLQNDAVLRKQSTPAAKKDRHSKIYTAQGPRDRRVRLSIGIARKFFDLQETLGFDKPSKTLDWLFTKSKAAIKDLVQSKQKTTPSPPASSPSSECDLISSVQDSKKKTRGAKCLAKESRAKARARARERTREKMCIKQITGATNNNNVFSSYNVPCSLPNEGHDLIQVKRKTTKSPSFFGFHQNNSVVSSRDHLSSNNYIIPSANPNDNWDVCNFNSSQSNLYAILDHHKFINSNSNI